MGALGSIKNEIQVANLKLDKILAILEPKEPKKEEPKKEVKKEVKE